MNETALFKEGDLVTDAVAVSKILEQRSQDALELNPKATGALTDAHAANALAVHLANLERMADSVEAQAKRFVEGTRARVAAMMGFYGDSLRALAQQEIGKKSPRAWDLPLATVRLRKQPLRVTQIEGDEAKSAFRRWDSGEDYKWTRIDAHFPSLTRAQLNKLTDALDEELFALFKYKIDAKKAELQQRFKETGEVPPGFEVTGGEDTVSVEFKDTLPAKGEGESFP